MIEFKKQLLIEASAKNLHLEHLEDEVLNGGVNGTRGAINFLRSLRDMLAGSSNSSTIITTKWDGAPAVSAGIDPKSGQFFVSYKSMKKLAFNQQDVKDNYEGALFPIYSALMEHLPKLKIKSNVYQGDVLWTNPSQLKVTNIDGQRYLTFTPNTITYAVPANSELAVRMKKAKVGIVFHTTYSTGGASTVDDLRASFGADTSDFASSPDVFAINAEFTDLSGHATFTDKETTKITSMLSDAGRTFNTINGRFLDRISQDKKIKVSIKTYINSKEGSVKPRLLYKLPNRISLKIRNPFIHGTLMIRKDSFLSINGYCEDFIFAQDYKLYSDLLNCGIKIKTLNEPLYVLNTFNNLTSKYKNEQNKYMKKVRKNIKLF